jgi:hypothetical protein
MRNCTRWMLLSTLTVSIAAAASAQRPSTPVGAAPTAAGPARMFGGPPVTAARSTLPLAPRRVTLPAASLTVYQFEVR